MGYPEKIQTGEGGGWGYTFLKTPVKFFIFLSPPQKSQTKQAQPLDIQQMLDLLEIPRPKTKTTCYFFDTPGNSIAYPSTPLLPFWIFSAYTNQVLHPLVHGGQPKLKYLISASSESPQWDHFRMGLFLKYGEAVLKIFTVFKACVHFFYQFFTISQNDSPLKTMKNECFLFHLKGSFRSQDIHIFVIFFLPFHAFQIRKDKWKWNNLWCHKLTCLNLQM